MSPAETTTRESLLDAAEGLFGQLGFGGASVRAITDAAGANVAAVNYHFGSKLGLIKEVLARRVGPLNAERLRRLEACEASSDSTLEDVVAAFVEPALEMVRDDENRASMARLLGNVFSHAGAELRPVLLDLFGPVIERFVPVLGRHLPNLAPRRIYWRFHFMVGATSFSVGLGHVAQAFSSGACDPSDADHLAEELVQFVAQGFRHQARLPGSGS